MGPGVSFQKARYGCYARYYLYQDADLYRIIVRYTLPFFYCEGVLHVHSVLRLRASHDLGV